MKTQKPCFLLWPFFDQPINLTYKYVSKKDFCNYTAKKARVERLEQFYKSLQYQQMHSYTNVYFTPISSYMFWLNCHHQGANTCITKTYRNNIVLQCLCTSNVQILVQIYSVFNT